MYGCSEVFVFAWFDVLRPSQQLWSCPDRSVHLTTHFPGHAYPSFSTSTLYTYLACPSGNSSKGGE